MHWFKDYSYKGFNIKLSNDLDGKRLLVLNLRGP